MPLFSLFHAPRRRLASLPLLKSHPFSPHSLIIRLPPTHREAILSSTPYRSFTASSHLSKRAGGGGRKKGKKGGGEAIDTRITLIRYFLRHPKQPRPLRFSRNRALRHWTIHRAWQLYQSKLRTAQELSLERQFNSMREACEALRLIGEDGLAIPQLGKSVPPPGARDLKTAVVGEGANRVEMDVQAAAARQQEVGRLYRIAMAKTRVWDGVPIEYARHQTETPPRNGWDHSWTR